MLLEQVISVSHAVRATRSRLTKRDAVAQLLRDATRDEVPLVASYLAGVLPQRRIGVGWRGLRDAPEPSGDASVTVRELDDTLSAVAAVSGAGSVGQRKELLASLFGRLTRAEQRFVTGLIQGELRQGAGDGVMLAAIAEASGVPEASVRRAVMLAGFTAPVAAAAMNGGADAVAGIGLVVGRPVRPMLAGSATEIAAAVDDGIDQQVETKLDGIRVQAHKIDDEVRLFTRSLEEITDRLPEVVEIVQQLPVERLVLDGEAVALTAEGRPQPFQVTGARTASSADPQRLRHETPVTPVFFDLLHLDGEDLIDQPFRERHQRLVDMVPASWVVAHAAVEGTENTQRFFHERVAAGDEGVVVKDLNAPYAAGRRGAGWVKVKPRHTLDLVVLAVEWGSGRRKGLLSNIHLGARDPETGGYVMLGKTFKGMTDEILPLADRAVHRAGDGPRRLGRAGPPGAGRRDRLRRAAALQPISRWAGAAFRAGDPLPRRQAGRGRRHHRHGSSAGRAVIDQPKRGRVDAWLLTTPMTTHRRPRTRSSGSRRI